SKDEIATALKLKSRWNKSLITRDLLVCFGVAAGGAWMIYQYLMNKCNEVVEHQ
nr:6K2 [Tobacco vein banding mosaic virus]